MKLIKLPTLLLLTILLASANLAKAQCPAITLNPTDITVCSGVTVKFIVVASGTGLTYQWEEFNGITWSTIGTTPYTGETTDTLTVSGTPAGFNGYKYRCRITKTGCTTVVSTAATLTLQYASYLNTYPVDTIICDGAVGAFKVDADGSGITYKWQQKITGVWTDLTNTSPFSGTNTNTLLVSNPSITLNGSFFRVIVAGTCPGGETSDSAKLSIKDKPKVLTQPNPQSVCAGTSVTFGMSAQGTNVAYQWQEDQGSGFVNLPGALPYSGTYSNQLTILTTGVTAAKNGWKYRCVVTGDCDPGDTTNAVVLNVQTSPSFSSISVPGIICEDQNIDIEVVASGSNLAYQWFENKIDGNGYHEVNDNATFSGSKTEKLRINNVPSAFNNYIYYCDISGSCAPKVISTDATLQVIQDKEVLTNPKDTNVIVNKTATFSITTQGTSLSYHWQVDDGKGFQNIDPGSPLYSGVLTTDLTVIKPKISQSGYKYRCLVYGGCDATPDASNGATLNVWWPSSVNEINSAGSNVIVYPNPVTGSQLTIETSDNVKNISVKIVDQFGRTLKSENLVLSANKATLNVSELPKGVYSIFVADKDANMIQNIKFTKL